MALDAYSLCPGGTGKKIKFCCPEFLPELQKIDRMLEGEQYMACLQHIQRTRELPGNGDRQCLLAQEVYLLHITQQFDEAKKLAAEFLEKHSTNTTALAECCIAAVIDGDWKSATGYLQRAFRLCQGQIVLRVYVAAKLLMQLYVSQNKFIAARELLQLLMQMGTKDESLLPIIAQFYKSNEVPLLLKDGGMLPAAPADAPWRQRYEEAIQPKNYGDWETTLAKLNALAKEVSNSPVIWKAVARACGALGDHQGCIAALRKDIAVDSSLEETVESEARIMFLSENPLGDSIDIKQIVWEVKDGERLNEALLSEPRLRLVPFNPSDFSTETSPPPKSVFMLLDRPLSDATEGMTFEEMPRFLGQVMFFGKQTDREARLEVIGLLASDVAPAKTLFGGLGAECFGPILEEKVIGTVSASNALLKPQWMPSRNITSRQLHDFKIAYRRQAILQRWPNQKLGCLDGKTPREALAEGVYKVRVLAAIMVLEEMEGAAGIPFDFNELRSKLGLPVLGPIDPEQCDLHSLPMMRLSRLIPEKLSDKDLNWALQVAMGYRIQHGVKKFGTELVNRPSFADTNERLNAFVLLAQDEEDLDRALEYLELGRQAIEKMGKSNVGFDFQELQIRILRREGDHALRLVQHIDRQHGKEPNVAHQLTELLIQFGVLRADGSPAVPVDEVPSEEMPTESSEPSRLWTPDSESSAGGGGGKLWTPD